MGIFRNLFDNVIKLTQGYDDDEDYFDGSQEEEIRPDPAEDNISQASAEFDNTFGVHNAPAASEPEVPEEQAEEAPPSGGFFSMFRPKGKKQSPESTAAYQAPTPAAAPASAPVFQTQRTAPSSHAAVGTAVIYTFNDITRAGELAGIVCGGQQVIMSLDGIDEPLARRLLDVTIGICAAANANITKVSGRTYYITPRF